MREIEKRLKKLIKNMNDRLYKLQKQKIYSRAVDYIKSELPERYQLLHVTKSGYIQFNQSLKNMTFNDLQHYEKILNKFKQAKTSTLRGAKAYNKNLDEFLKEKIGEKNMEHKNEIFDSAWFDSAKKNFGASETFNIIKEYGEKMADEIFTNALKDGTKDLVGLWEIVDKVKQRY